jgi:class 3 adenylate cyclase
MRLAKRCMLGRVKDEIRYCTTSDGVQIAYSVMGQGPPLVRVLGWFTHLEYESQVPFWRTFIERHSDHYTLIRYDGRGTGLSDRNVDMRAEGGFVRDLEAVVEASGFDRVALCAISQGGFAGMSYTIDHPGRVSHLVIYGSFARNYLTSEQLDLMRTVVRQGWGSDVPAHRQFFTGLFMPDNPSVNDLNSFNELQRVSATPEIVSAMLEGSPDSADTSADLVTRLGEIRVPTLVMHRRGDAIVPFEEGRLIAAKIPGARFLPLEGSNHTLVEGEDAIWDQLLDATDELILGNVSVTPKAEASAFRTVLFTDLVGHTQMMQRLGDDRGRDVLREHERITREVLKENGGTEVKTMGDGFMASFSSITRAVECAVALQRAFAGHNESAAEPMSVRVGLNAGEPIEEDGDLFGSTVILASRIAAKAEGGEILVADTVRGLCSGKGFLFADRGEFVAKGFEDPVRVYQVSWRHG